MGIGAILASRVERRGLLGAEGGSCVDSLVELLRLRPFAWLVDGAATGPGCVPDGPGALWVRAIPEGPAGYEGPTRYEGPAGYEGPAWYEGPATGC